MIFLILIRIRKREKNSWQRFGRVYRENWKTGILPTAVFLAAATLLTKLLVGLWNAAVAGSLPWMAFSGMAFVGVLVLGIVSVLFPMLSRFENPFGVLLKNTVLLSLANLPRTLALGVLNGAAIYVCVRFVIPVFVVPALAALCSTALLEPMFRPYMPTEDAA